MITFRYFFVSQITLQGQVVDKVFVSHPYAVPQNDTVCYGKPKYACDNLSVFNVISLVIHLPFQQFTASF